MKSNLFKGMLKNPVAAAMTLVQTLFFAGCASGYKSSPTILNSPRGNAMVATLPTNSEIRVKQNPAVLFQAFVNEMRLVSTNSDGSWVLKTTTPLKIATESYLFERDERELLYIKEILQLRSFLNHNTNTNPAECNYGK